MEAALPRAREGDLAPGGLSSTGLTLAILIVVAGRRLNDRTHYTFCFVVACFAMVIMPFGTILGVFTVVVLSREAVKAMFAERAAQRG